MRRGDEREAFARIVDDDIISSFWMVAAKMGALGS